MHMGYVCDNISNYLVKCGVSLSYDLNQLSHIHAKAEIHNRFVVCEILDMSFISFEPPHNTDTSIWCSD